VLRRFRPTRQVYLLFARLPAPVTPAPLPEFVIQSLATPNDPLAQSLDEFCTAHGFPPGWPGEMLTQGARAFIAQLPGGGQIAATAWLTTHAFYVEEIDHTLDPAGGAYLFGDFVTPPYRGRRLQRTLLAHRLAHLPAGSPAYTIIRDDNIPSIRNFESMNVTARLTHTRWLGRSKWTCVSAAASDKNLPTFERQTGNRLVPKIQAASSST
jgi:hypothetical protein